jgi:hypothetical protein
MRAVRFLSLALLMVVGFAGAASAQYNNTPGVYNVNVGIVPAMLPPGSLPPDAPSVGPDLYHGTLTVTKGGGGYSAQFKGERDTDGAKLNASATFNNNWAGFKLGNLIVGSSNESDCIVGIDGANMESANINGVGTVEGTIQRLIAKFGAGGVLTSWKVNKAPGNLR